MYVFCCMCERRVVPSCGGLGQSQQCVDWSVCADDTEEDTEEEEEESPPKKKRTPKKPTKRRKRDDSDDESYD